MFIFTAKYKDYNDVERTEKFYFNLTEAELTEMEMSVDGGFADMVQKIVEAQDMPTLVKVFKDFIFKSYGEKSPDGKRFMKVDENGHSLAVAFSQTEAYSQLFMKLATDAKFASEFVNHVIPNKDDKSKAPAPVLPQTANAN